MTDPTPMNDDDRELIRANLNKMMAETMKISAETTKILAEQRYYPMVALGSVIVAALGAAVVIIKLAF